MSLNLRPSLKLTVDGFCRTETAAIHSIFQGTIPSDMVHLILMFYAKPMTLMVTYEGNFRSLQICPTQQNSWPALNRQLALSFKWYNRKHDVYQGSLQYTDSSGNSSSVDRSTWDTFHWNELRDVFVWKPHERAV